MDPLLSLDSVRKGYVRGHHRVSVLIDISLDVHAGDLMAVWGQRRAGKTTLLRVAAGLEDPDRGTVSFAGRDLATRRDSTSHLQEIAWVQCARPRNNVGTVLECVSLTLLLSDHSHREARRRALDILGRFGLADCAGEQWEDLPDRQRTLVSIASALARKPRLLIADDLTVGLDLLEREQVMTILRQAADEQGMGILITIDEMSDIRLANRIGVLSHGELLTPGESPSDRGVLIEFPGKRQSA